MVDTAGQQEGNSPKGSASEVFVVFLKLGLTSFGGPIAHLGYFRDELVVRRNWIDDKGYADLVALCQFLPGPASSQVGFALGLLRGGPLGALAAWAAFTLPSAILLVSFAYGAMAFDGPIATRIIDGLKIVAIAIVAQAVWGMAKHLCPDRERASIALIAMVIVVLAAGAVGQVLAIVVGAAAGLLACRKHDMPIESHIKFPVSRKTGAVALALFFGLLAGLPLIAAATSSPELAVFGSFYRAGSLVFGGGHVVLPLLEAEVAGKGWISEGRFLTGYGAAQAVPGPLFAFAAYLGAALEQKPNGLIGAAIALTGIFLPGFLILLGVIPFWGNLRNRTGAQALIRGANAAVVGILGAALYDPLFTGTIVGPHQFLLALSCFVLLVAWKMPPWLVVLFAAGGGVVIGIL